MADENAQKKKVYGFSKKTQVSPNDFLFAEIMWETDANDLYYSPMSEMTICTTITIGWFVYATKEVKSRLHYLNEYHMNFEREILKVLSF